MRREGEGEKAWRGVVRMVLPDDDMPVYQAILTMAKIRDLGVKPSIILDGVELDERELEQRWRDVVLRETQAALAMALGKTAPAPARRRAPR